MHPNHPGGKYRPIHHSQFTITLVTPQQPTTQQLQDRWLDARRLTQRARLLITGQHATMRREDGMYITQWDVTYKGQTPHYDRRQVPKGGPAR